MKEIQDSNDRHIGALEESLSFAMDSLTAVSERQHSADIDIVLLRKKTADLRRRLQLLELDEDRRQQEKRLTSLVFSGRTLQAQTGREDAARLIRSLVQQCLRHALDNSQVKAMIRLRNGKMLIDFNAAAPSSDRDVLFRSKSKLRGSGLFITESLTPRRQAIFSDLLQLKKEGVIFSAFTRSGDILACRSRDSAPIRITGPEAVRQLTETGAPLRPGQGRVQAGDAADPPAPSLWREVRGGARERGRSPSGVSAMEVAAHSPDDPSQPALRDTGVGPRRQAAEQGCQTWRYVANLANFERLWR